MPGVEGKINDAFGKTYEVKIRRKEMEKWVSEKD